MARTLREREGGGESEFFFFFFEASRSMTVFFFSPPSSSPGAPRQVLRLYSSLSMQSSGLFKFLQALVRECREKTGRRG